MLRETLIFSFICLKNERHANLLFHLLAEAHPGPNQAFKMDFFAKIVNGFKLTLLTILAKSSSVDV